MGDNNLVVMGNLLARAAAVVGPTESQQSEYRRRYEALLEKRRNCRYMEQRLQETMQAQGNSLETERQELQDRIRELEREELHLCAFYRQCFNLDISEEALCFKQHAVVDPDRREMGDWGPLTTKTPTVPGMWHPFVSEYRSRGPEDA